MAKILNKDPVTYQRERDGFIRDLRQFHETRGTPFRKTPKINGREIDLYLLYVLVTAHGGWIKVNSRNEWESLLDHFGLTKHCVNGSVGLKQIYLRYLDRYEKVHYLGEDVDRGSDDDEESRHRRWSARALHSVPLTYNHHQHNVADTLRSYNGLSVNLYKPSDYDRLSLSLISPLPNEQDFAINVCTLLSNEGKHTLKLDKCPRLIDFLLAHAGVFNHSSLRQLFEEVYGKVRKHSVHCFWTDALGDSDMGDLEDETKFPTAKSKIKEVICDDTGGKGVVAGASSLTDKFSRSSSRCSDRIGTKTTDAEPPKFLMDSDGAGEKPVVEKMEVDETPSKTENEKEKTVDSSSAMDVESEVPEKTNSAEDGERTGATKVFEEGEDGLLSEVDSQKAKTENHLKVPLKIEPSDLELFCLGRSFGTQDYIGQRVLQVATILRNLSFGEENVSVLARSVPFLRFLLLCASSKWNQLHQLGLDMLGNVAGEVILEDPGYDRLASCLLSTVTRGLHSQDRYVVVSCLEVLNKLSQKDENEDVMLRCLDQQVYDQVCTFLTLHDIMLLIHTLECLYSLSSLGERACNNIVRVHGAIDTLVSLITVEAQSYGPKACILMRVVETVSGTQSAATTTTTTTSTAMAANPSPQPMMATPVRPPLSALPHRHTPQRIWVSSAGMVVGAPQPAVATPVHLTLAQNPHPYHPPPPPPPQQQQQQQPPPPPPPPQQPQQQQPLVHQQAAQENEQFALAWLRATFEPAAGCRIEQAELYKQYLTACAKIGRRGVIAPLHFPRCVRSVFGGSVGPNPQKSMVGVSGGAEQPSGSILMFYEGIKVRPAPFTIPVSASSSVQHVQQPSAAQVILQTQSSHVQRKGITVVSKTVTPSPPPPPPPQAPTPPATQVVITENPSTGGDVSLSLTPAPASPILKAQLSAPPKQREASKADVKSQVLAHPHLTQALLGSSGGSPSPAGSKPAMVGSSKDTQAGGNGPPSSSTSLIKSLLATKVNATGSECMMAQPTAAVAASSMLPAACSTTTTTTTASTSTKQTLPHAPQVTQRQQQQRLLQQQLQQKKDSISPPPAPALSTASSNNIQGKVIAVQAATPSKGKPATVVTTSTTVVKPTPDPRQRISRINGARTPLQVQPQAATPLQQTQVQTQANSQVQVQPQIQQQVDSMKDAEDSSTNSNSITCSNENSSNSDASGGATNSTNTGIPSCGTSVITQAPPKLVAENHVPPPAFSVNSSNAALRGRREPPQPPPPPLAPLSNSRIPPRLDLEDSDSTGNNSLASSSRDCSAIGTGNISTDDGENSLTSFEGLLLNGIPHPLDIDAASNDSSSKDSARSLPHLQNQSLKPPTTKSLMLADLLEKKVDKKDPPVINGILPKELRIGEKGLELVENHLEKVLKETSVIQAKPGEVKEPSRNTGGVSGSDVSGVVRTAGQVANNVTNAEKDNSAFKTVGIGTTDEPLLTNSVVCSTEHIRFGVATQQTQTVQATKRPAAETIGLEDGEVEAKRPHLSSENAVNGSASPGPVNPSSTGTEQSNPAPPSPDSNDKSSNASNDNSEGVNASPSAANLYAALAASALEDEPDLELTPPPPPAAQVLVQSAGGLRQAVFLGQGVDPSQQQQLIVAAPRQIIVSQGQIAPQGQVLISAGGQLTLQQNPNTGTIKASSGHQGVPVLVQTGSSASQRAQIAAVSHSQAPQLVQTGQVVLSQSSSGQFILSQAPAQGQVQLVQTGSGQASQYIVQASSSSGQAHYVVAQPQTALVQGQTQTVLVAQTQQQQGTGTKTIIILQPQSSSSATHHQKVVVTPQGQPVVVTQVPRPILQSSAISSPSSTIQPPALVPTSSAQPPSPASPAPQTIKHVVSSTAAPVHMPSRVVQSTPHSGPTGTSTSLPPQSRALTPNPPSTGVVTITSTLASATKTISKPQTVHPSITSTVSRAPLSPSANSVNIVKAGTVSVATAATTSSAAFQSKQQSRVLPNSRPQTPGMVPEASPIQEKSVIQHPVRVGTPSPMQTRSQTPQHRAGMTPSLDQALFLCEWRGCMRSFKSANEVYMHACEAHCPSGSEEIQCLWERCDAMKRKRFSLMTHLYDRHCNADVLRMMAVRRRQLSQSGRSEIPPPQPPPPHPGYAPNAAFHAIKRHALEFVNPKEMMDDNEGPVTKSIRLTSSLILRNLVIYSTNGRRFLRSYEPHLASVALSNVESSRTIAQVLYDMNQQTSRR